MIALGQSMLYWDKTGAPSRSATVAHLNTDGTLNLTVLGAGGEIQYPERRVPLVAQGEPPPVNGRCCRERAL